MHVRRRDLGAATAFVFIQFTVCDVAVDLRVRQFGCVAAIDVLDGVQAGRRIDFNENAHRAAVQVLLRCGKVLNRIETLLIQVGQVEGIDLGLAVEGDREVRCDGKCAVEIIDTRHASDRQGDLAFVVVREIVKILV